MNHSESSSRRTRMIEEQLVARGITNPLVLRAFARIPREVFVPSDLADDAYGDHPLSIGSGQTISQPYIVARMLVDAELTGDERVLEIGTGSGYSAAVLAQMAREVHTIERFEHLATAAASRLTALGIAHAHVHVGDGTLGWFPNAPYDVIIVTAVGPRVPKSLRNQLAVHGRLVMPVAATRAKGQVLIRVRRLNSAEFTQEELEPVKFVPLVGAEGYAPGKMDGKEEE